MKKFLLPLLALGVMVGAAPHKAEAHSRFFFDFGFPVFAPAYYAPPIAYYPPPPPRVVYYAPPPVVYAQPVQYYQGPPPGYHYEYRPYGYYR